MKLAALRSVCSSSSLLDIHGLRLPIWLVSLWLSWGLWGSCMRTCSALRSHLFRLYIHTPVLLHHASCIKPILPKYCPPYVLCQCFRFLLLVKPTINEVLPEAALLWIKGGNKKRRVGLVTTVPSDAGGTETAVISDDKGLTSVTRKH